MTDMDLPTSTDYAWNEDVEGWQEDLVRVSREVSFFDLDNHRERPVEEFAALLVAATNGLSDTRVDGHNYYDSVRVVVTGCRPPTAEEMADRERRERLGWIAAKGIYERGLERFGSPTNCGRPMPTGRCTLSDCFRNLGSSGRSPSPCEAAGCRYPAKYRAVFDPPDFTASRGEVRLLCGVHGNYRLAEDGWKMTPLTTPPARVSS